jgi:hypothetical protein
MPLIQVSLIEELSVRDQQLIDTHPINQPTLCVAVYNLASYGSPRQPDAGRRHLRPTGVRCGSRRLRAR